MRPAFRPKKAASYVVRKENREKMKILKDERPFGYGIGMSKGEKYNPKHLMLYPPDSWLVSVWIETGIVGLVLYIISHIILFAWCSWLLLFKTQNNRLRGLLSAWLCMAIGFFVSAYANDVMQYPNSIPVYTGLALCFAAPYIDKTINCDNRIKKDKEKMKEEEVDKYKFYNPLK